MPRKVPGLDGQRFFGTWSQAHDIDIDSLADFLSSLQHFEWLEIVQESHQDDGIHYHAVVVFASRFRGDMRAFDFEGNHPNIRAIKNATVDLVNYRHYIRKGAERSKEDEHTVKSHKTKACDYIIEPDTRGTVPIYVATSGRLDWGGILREATDEATFLALVRINQPKEWVLRNTVVRQYAERHFKKEAAPETVYPQQSWNVPPELDQWCKDVFSEVSLLSWDARSPVRLLL